MLDLIPPVPLEKTKEFYRYVKRTGGRIWSIRVGRAIAGAVGILPGDPETKLGHSASLFIYLAKRYWGQGIGSRALQTALAEAKREGLERIEVLAVESNARARGLFTKNGFEEEGLLRKAFKTGQEYQNLVVMARFV
jgi:RimJ/RimL family protein N-acetyltransferase